MLFYTCSAYVKFIVLLRLIGGLFEAVLRNLIIMQFCFLV